MPPRESRRTPKTSLFAHPFASVSIESFGSPLAKIRDNAVRYASTSRSLSSLAKSYQEKLQELQEYIKSGNKDIANCLLTRLTNNVFYLATSLRSAATVLNTAVTLLKSAIYANSASIFQIVVDTLIEWGINPNIIIDQPTKETTLHMLIFRMAINLQEDTTKEDGITSSTITEFIENILKFEPDADINPKNDDNITPLHWVSFFAVSTDTFYDIIPSEQTRQKMTGFCRDMHLLYQKVRPNQYEAYLTIEDVFGRTPASNYADDEEKIMFLSTMLFLKAAWSTANEEPSTPSQKFS